MILDLFIYIIQFYINQNTFLPGFIIRKETENKTIRFPISLVNEIEKAIVNQDVTFSRFVIQACEYALENMETN